jgi:hypothetical protein
MGNKSTVYRLKSYNFDSWVSEAAYQVISWEMSTGDYATHRKRAVELDANQLDNLIYHGSTRNKFGKVVKERKFTDFSDGVWLYYDGLGDCYCEGE